ncbi:MAG: 3-keto-disaccharide hydrolase [Planctomycetota bacterium]
MRPHLIALVSLAVVPLTAQHAPELLWNGVDLSGWHGQRHFSPYKLAAMDAASRQKLRAEDDASVAEHWSVQDGELVNDGHGAFLTTDQDYGDAVFTLEYKTVAQADSGIYLRGCPQVQIWDYTEAGGKWNLGADKGSGGLWNNQEEERFPSRCYDRPFGAWNQLQITMVGEIVWVSLNGHVTVDGVRMENYWDRSRPLPRKGPLQLQTHGGEIRFRNLTVRELSSHEADSMLASRDANAYVSAFDGATFAGWQGATDNYEVVDGAIRCKQGKGGTLFTSDELSDFSVRLHFQLPPGGNNGLAMRYPGKGDAAYTGFELQVLDNTADKYKNLKPWQFHGSAYGLQAAHRGYQRPVGEWNFQQVTMRGARVQVELNGYRILDADLSKLESQLKNATGKDNPSGYFGFAGHNDPVAFTNIRIRRL